METTPLPIGVVMPVLNCRAELPSHLEQAKTWLPSVAEVYVVDSFSSDGSLEFLRENLRHSKAEFLSHPPGLYQSWNFGISKVQSDYLYVSTIGDAISLDGLTKMVSAARRLETDVLVSPPVLQRPDGSKLPEIRWPVHELIDKRKINHAQLIDPFDLFCFAAAFAIGGGMTGLMGSSASNLYRTKTFQRLPFPVDFGTTGDTAWGVRNALNIRFGIFPETCSTFIVQPKTNANTLKDFKKESSARLDQEIKHQLETVNSGEKSAKMLALLDTAQSYHHTRRELEKFRLASFPWILRPAAWSLRLKRTQLKRSFYSLRSELMPDSAGELLNCLLKH